MVVRGNSRGNGAQLADYLMLQADNDNVRVFDIRGTSQPDNLKASLLEMSLTSELTRSQKGLYHAQINPAYGEDKKMQPEDWSKAADIMEKELKLNGQKRVIVFHEKKGRLHAHVVWERYDHEKGKMVSDSYSRLAQDRARKTMEKEFEQKPTPIRNKRQPEIQRTLTEVWQKTKTGAEFVKEAFQKGYVVAKGQLRRPFMVVDDTGRSFDLIRQLKGTKTKEVRERLQRETLPTEKEAILQVRERQTAKTVDPWSHVREREAQMATLVEQKKQELQQEIIETERERLVRQLKEQLERNRQQNKEKGFER
ncbi:relaxase [Niastella koreensis]|uniref:Relaxase/mobilization nuclease family protein n=2 Tax=Niastella koreensis TaxID=354356 RepID=G8TJG1_NIAKG|nr:relaxase/mobilization nuclease domain-containing protein [Niastella koreensis]AEV99696.1 Relaxase/mobilization nuclease family protein [Niastella koreensis GR20-10]OQP44277.1 relaxase [Niastella koreensis]